MQHRPPLRVNADPCIERAPECRIPQSRPKLLDEAAAPFQGCRKPIRDVGIGDVSNPLWLGVATQFVRNTRRQRIAEGARQLVEERRIQPHARTRTAGAAFGELARLGRRRRARAVGRRQPERHVSALLKYLISRGTNSQVFEKTFYSESPRASISYKINNDLNVYSSYSAGVRPGGFNATLAGLPTPLLNQIISQTGSVSTAYKQEKMWQAEIGVKAEFFDNTVRTNVSLYKGKLTNEQELVQAAGANIGELIDDLEKTYPGIKERLCDQNGNVRRFVNIFLNDEDIRFLEDKGTAVKEGDEISIVPAIAGG